MNGKCILRKSCYFVLSFNIHKKEREGCVVLASNLRTATVRQLRKSGTCLYLMGPFGLVFDIHA